MSDKRIKLNNSRKKKSPIISLKAMNNEQNPIQSESNSVKKAYFPIKSKNNERKFKVRVFWGVIGEFLSDSRKEKANFYLKRYQMFKALDLSDW